MCSKLNNRLKAKLKNLICPFRSQIAYINRFPGRCYWAETTFGVAN